MRIEFPDTISHVMSRGNARQKIFCDDRDDPDYQRLLNGLQAVVARFACQVLTADALRLGHPGSAGNLVRRIERERSRSASLSRDLRQIEPALARYKT